MTTAPPSPPASPPVPSRVVAALRASWSRDTCDVADVGDWTPDRPSRGQCGATALVLHDLFGGDLLLAEVWHADGTLQGYHWWNRLPGGAEVDLTRDQFGPGEVHPPRVVVRPEGPPRRCRAQYELLRRRVLDRLDGPG
ncbi:hypothetical protein FVA95_08105 [Pseudonocardia sp. EV170527-09]|uniref:YunG family protein n=1 Tax=Pseudonocardia sp. EV170527-09 TaxID=2603411 RepID=UPI0011F1D73C|nr:hypothetical protein [Pseudonocardia sp. EV170527-09]KAA1031889.1 hypothetical protein FVA95_08105 [Pseudonocardia sp. EV170527-09]